MAESYLRQSPLAHLGLESRAQAERGAAGIAMAERRFPGIVNLRGKAEDEAFAEAAQKVLGFALPVEPNTAAGKGKTQALWLGPDEWWAVGEDGAKLAAQLAVALDGQGAGVTEVGESRTCIRISGPKARDLLAKGCSLDLHPRVFGPGRCAQTLLAKAEVVLHQIDDEPAYEVTVARSFAEYLWLWLEDAAGEYGMAVVTG